MTHRIKNFAIADDDYYDEEDDEYDQDQTANEYTDEDRDNFASLTPVVRAELDEAGIPATTAQIEEALWHYYWDVGKSVAYLKNSSSAPPQQSPKKESPKIEKPKSKFDEAVQKSAQNTASSKDWFRGIPWTSIPAEMRGELVPLEPTPPQIRLLGGSSKLAKLAEERRKRAAAGQTGAAPPSEALNSLDRLSLSNSNTAKENEPPARRAEAKRYPVKRKKSPTPPPREPTPPPEEPKEQLPDLRTPPTAFGRTLSTSSEYGSGPKRMSLQDLFGSDFSAAGFQGPSPDDTVSKAQERSKGLNK